jgi:Fe-S-cluster containining protein
MLTDVPHGTDEDGEHDPGACYRCIAEEEPVQTDCRCGACCRSLILEATAEDGVVEPLIKEKCSPLYEHPQLTGGTRELIGYLLNADDGPCTFLDRQTNLCGIYNTRPLMCRLFDCDGEDREELVQLGILPPKRSSGTNAEDGARPSTVATQ